ncbi:acetyl-coenzyme A carboxylase carboxyl transferase subunit beta [Anaerocolumna cellulosilytica]|uniref:Acetyl-coenzyme A carboxylase carboxyl transferase subunit beta n=2 Tax=Anaerocolumna cellulosilytica TaxID=433286 RepID=A0A6S6R9H8_9FIRM|nr:acetyl-coenzyme A carboxylase carboxyl transferase subunit beta [Anaerocolumna cellulosilytica]
MEKHLKRRCDLSSMLKEMFKKNDLTSAGRKQVHLGGKVKESLDEAQIPDGLFEKCDKCNEIVYSEDVVANYYICPNCGMYFRISPRTRLSMILDKESFQEWDKELPVSDPLNFPGYKQKLEHLKVVTNLDEAVITGEGKINDTSVAIGIMASNFLMGSMGEVVGEKLTRLVEKATKRKLPVIIFCCSGGARMQEGIISLMQMAKTAQALKRHDEAGLLYVSVLTDPTTGGVMASFAMLGDVILAEPGALIGFAGPRVIEQTIGQRLPEGFQKAEFLLEHGFVDKIVKRNKLKQTLSMLVKSC